MLDFIVQKKAALLLVALLAAMLLLMSRDIHKTGGSTPVGHAVTRFSDPLVKGSSSAIGSLSDRWSSLTELRGLSERTHKLESEVESLRMEKLRWESEVRENERLRRLLALKSAFQGPTLASRIAAFSPTEDRTILIDRGQSDGVREGMSVISPSGVLGKVILVSDSLSKVLLLTDPSSGVAIAEEDGRYQGMLVGRGEGLCDLLYLPAAAKVVPGDSLVTSGLDRVYPPGLPAGRVISVQRGLDGSLQVRARPEASPADSEGVLVVLSAATEPGKP